MVYNISCCLNQRIPKKMEQEKKIRREIANSNERRRMQSINAGFNSLRTMLPKHDNEKLSKAAILQHTAEYIDQLEQDKTRFLQEIRGIKKLLNQFNPELLEMYQKSLQESDSKLVDKQPTFKRIKLEVNNSLDSESSDEGIQLGNSSPKQENNQQLNNQTNGKQYSSMQKSVSLTSIAKNGFTPVSISNNQQLVNNNQLITNKANDLIIDSDDIDVLRAELVQVRKVLDKERKLRMKLEEQVRALEAQLYPTRIKEIAQQVQLQFQTTGINLIQQQQHQIKDNELETAVSSVMIEPQQHELIAETVEIETQDCTDFLNNNSTNQLQLISSTNPHFNQTLSPSNVHIIQDLENNTLIDTTNFIQSPEKIIEINEASNKILTSTAYVTATNLTITNKPIKSTNKIQDKTKQKCNTNLTSANNNPHLSTKKTPLSTTVNLLPNKSILPNETELTKQKSDKEINKQKKLITQPAAIALPIDVPFIFDSTINNLELRSNEIVDQSIVPPASRTVTVHLIQDVLTSTTDKFESTTATSLATSAGRNNNLDTIVEAIIHLEGNSFGVNEIPSNLNVSIDNIKQLDKDLNSIKDKLNNDKEDHIRISLDQNDLKKDWTNLRPGVIVSSSNT